MALTVIRRSHGDLATAKGLELAIKNRNAVANEMTPDQIAEAQRLAREWKPSAER